MHWTHNNVERHPRTNSPSDHLEQREADAPQNPPDEPPARGVALLPVRDEDRGERPAPDVLEAA